MTHDLEARHPRRRRRETRRGVWWAERTSRVLISIGGIGTIVAVTTICAFLVWVVWPLFQDADLQKAGAAHTTLAAGVRPLHVAEDEYRVIAWALYPDGKLVVFRPASGDVLETRDLFEGVAVTGFSYTEESGRAAFGFADGSVRLGHLGFRTEFLPAENVPPSLAGLHAHASTAHDGGIVERTAEGALRIQRPAVTLESPVAFGGTTPVILVDRAEVGSTVVVAAFDQAGSLTIHRVESETNLLTKEVTLTDSRATLPYVPPPGRGPPRHLMLAGAGDDVVVAWEDGYAIRYDCRNLDAPAKAEALDLVARDGDVVTSLAWLLGKTTLLVGDSSGDVHAWFRTKRPGVTGTSDGSILESAHRLPGAGAAVAALAVSSRNRLVAVGYADGSLRLFEVTSERLMASDTTAPREPFAALAISPKDDGILGLTASRAWRWDADMKHPEAGIGALIGKVWYEGYGRPEHVWQSTSGTDDFEKKLGLMPLVFGTLKATLYSMLFGAPIALLAAIFTSEFLSPRVKTPVKSVIEMMASLPSVVLGFLAALVIAPFVQRVVPTVLASFATIPFVLLLGAYLWQLVPQGLSLRLAGWPRFLLITASFPLGVGLAALVAPGVETALFEGAFVTWLDGKVGSATGGWVMVLLPFAALVVAVTTARLVGPWLRGVSVGWDRRTCAQADLVKFAACVVAAVLLALGLGFVLSGLGADPRARSSVRTCRGTPSWSAS